MSSLPTIKKRAVWHVGARISRRKPERSLEGLALSVSEYPEEWAQIAKLRATEVWKLTPKSPRRPGVFLDVWSVRATLRKTLTTQCVSEGLLTKKPMWRVYWKEEERGERYSDFVSRDEAQAELEYHVEEEGEESRMRRVLVPWPTDKLDAIWLGHFSAPLGHDVAEEVAWQVILERDRPELDGFWWDDVYDPYNLSAPRGGIFYSRISRWNWTPSSVEEAQDEVGEPPEIEDEDEG